MLISYYYLTCKNTRFSVNHKTTGDVCKHFRHYSPQHFFIATGVRVLKMQKSVQLVAMSCTLLMFSCGEKKRDFIPKE